MVTWKNLKRMLGESRQFRGDSFVPFKELQQLFAAAKLPQPDPSGGMVTGNYAFDPTVLALGDAKQGNLDAWHDEMDAAVARASTDSAKQIGGHGAGGTMTKGTYGNAGARMSMAPRNPHHNDRLGSTMDRYDVVISADIDYRINKKGKVVPTGMLKRIAWAPSMGDTQQRGDRLVDLMSGKGVGELPRRPQASRPGISKDDEKRWADQAARKKAADDAASEPSIGGGDDVKPMGGGSASNSDFAQRLAKHNAQYKAGPQRKPDDDEITPGMFSAEPPTRDRDSVRMAGPKQVRTYPGGLATDRDKLRRIRNLPRPKIPSDED